MFIVALVSSISAQPAPLLARSGKVLQVLVPVKPDFKEFVECDSSPVKGFCIDVFKSALGILIPKANWTDVNYTCFDIGDDTYDTMVNALYNESYDAVVGDVTISASRLENASFTQSYLDSGIVVVTPADDVSQNFPGVFFVPFSIHTWLVMIASIALTGLALWLLEYNGNPCLQRSESKSEQFRKVFWDHYIPNCM